MTTQQMVMKIVEKSQKKVQVKYQMKQLKEKQERYAFLIASLTLAI